MRPDAALEAMADRVHVQIDALQGAEGVLDVGELLVIQDRGFGAHVAGRNAGADHIETIERGFGGHAPVIDRKAEGAILDVEIEVLGDFIFADHLADPYTDLIAACEAAGHHHGLDLVEFACFGRDDVAGDQVAFTRRLGVDQLIEAQPLHRHTDGLDLRLLRPQQAA